MVTAPGRSSGVARADVRWRHSKGGEEEAKEEGWERRGFNAP